MLDVENVTLLFNRGTSDQVKGLDGLSLHLDKGDFVTMIGSNGSGKSTLMNVIFGTLLSTSGRVLLDGEDITMQPSFIRSKNIGMLFQDPMRGSAPGMTIEENLALAAGRGGWFSGIRRSDRELFRERLARLGMGLENSMDRPVGLLSGGQRQALTLLMATINPPKLLLLDEHTAALDPATAEKVLKITEETVAENKLTCLMITHNMEDALRLGNRTIMMNRGKIVYDVSGDERKSLGVPDLLARFKEASGRMLDSDRVLLS